MKKTIAFVLALALLPSVAAAEKKWNPLTWFGDAHHELASECGWMIGHPFTLDGQQTQLALQVFTGSGAPFFLARFDRSDEGFLDRESEPGMILRLKNGAYRRTNLGELPVVLADSHARKGWRLFPKIPKAASKCGLRKAVSGKFAHLDFFGAYSHLIAGAALAGEQDVFNAYFHGRDAEAFALLEKAQEIEAAAAAFLGLSESRNVVVQGESL